MALWKYTIKIYVTYEIQYIIIYVIKLINSIMISILRFSDSQNLEQFYRTISRFHLLSSMDTAWENDNFSCDICKKLKDLTYSDQKGGSQYSPAIEVYTLHSIVMIFLYSIYLLGT